MTATDKPKNENEGLVPLLRVTALALAVGLGIAGVAFAMPVLMPDAKASPAAAEGSPKTKAKAEAAVNVTTPNAASGAPALAPRAPDPGNAAAAALPGLVTAIATGEEVEETSSVIPRPAGATRIYTAPLEETMTMTVYQTGTTPDQAITAYTASLKSKGFDWKKQAAKEDEGDGSRKTAHLFTKGDVQAIVTVSPGESGALVTVVEGPKAILSGDGKNAAESGPRKVP